MTIPLIQTQMNPMIPMTQIQAKTATNAIIEGNLGRKTPCSDSPLQPNSMAFTPEYKIGLER